MTSNNQHMTKAEQTDLCRLIRLQMKVKRNEVDEYSARQEAEMERQLAAKYDAQDRNFRKIWEEAEAAVRQEDVKLAERSREMGIPDSFRPSIRLGWFGRGENASKDRRTELRRMGHSEIEARNKAAKVKLDRVEAQMLTEIVAKSLRSEEAMRCLENMMPQIQDLVPAIELGELEKKVPMLPRGGY